MILILVILILSVLKKIVLKKYLKNFFLCSSVPHICQFLRHCVYNQINLRVYLVYFSLY